MHLQPGEMAFYTSLYHLPWTIQIVYGVISDNFPFFGFYRKSYLVAMGALQFVSLIAVYAGGLYTSPFYFTLFLTITNFAEAV